MANHIYTQDEQRQWQRQLEKKNVSSNVLVCCGQEILIVKPNYKSHWTLPGGVVDKNESPKQAAARELQEETGIVADQLEFAGVSYMPGHSGFPDKLTFSFIYNCSQKPALVLQEEEIEESDWVKFDTLLDKTGKKRAFYANIQDKLVDDNFPFYSDLTIID